MIKINAQQSLQTILSGLDALTEEQVRFCKEYAKSPESNNSVVTSHNTGMLIASFLNKTKDVAGHIAEVGVWKGGTSLFIRKYLDEFASIQKTLYAYDTFTGIPNIEPSLGDPERLIGYSNNSPDDVIKRFEGMNDVIIRVGVFPDTLGDEKNESFSFVHLDVDSYLSYMDCLEFWPARMQKGGVILMDDYNAGSTPGATRAVNEWIKKDPECDAKFLVWGGARAALFF